MLDCVKLSHDPRYAKLNNLLANEKQPTPRPFFTLITTEVWNNARNTLVQAIVETSDVNLRISRNVSF
jgi:hypothetical protein